MLLNIHNYKSFFRIFVIFNNPIQFLFSLVFNKVPQQITLRTPIGKIEVNVRNFESLKTIFSIFCREDYFIKQDCKNTFMDVGSNCGYSSLYFLTRNKDNNVICYEPDRKNLDFLKSNLKAFKNRSSIRNVGIAVESGYSEFYLTADGKYNSLLEMKDYDEKVTIELVNFNDEIDKCSDNNSLIIKIDVEGIEKDLIKEINFENKKNVSQLIIESNDCSRHISRKHKRILVNGYVEHIIFQ